MKKREQQEKYKQVQQLMNEVAEGKEPSIKLLVAMYNDASPPTKGFLNHHIMKILMVEMPKLKICNDRGPTLDTGADEFQNVSAVFRQTLEFAEKKAPALFKELTATLRYGGEEISNAIDQTIRRCILQDKIINREAYMDVLSSHAELVSAIKHLTDVPEGLNSGDADSTAK